MKKITNLVAVIIIGTLLFSAVSKNSKKREVNRLLGEYLYSLHYSEKEVDKRLTKKAQAICDSFGGKGRKIKVKYDLEPLSKGWNAYTTQLSDGTYLIVTSNETDKTLYHEVAHVLTFEEAAIHGPSWKMMLTKMGYPNEAARYNNH
jgi:hypothetical protein